MVAKFNDAFNKNIEAQQNYYKIALLKIYEDSGVNKCNKLCKKLFKTIRKKTELLLNGSKQTIPL